MTIHLSKDENIRERQLRALKRAKQLKYPEEYKKHLEEQNRSTDDSADFFDALTKADRVEARL